MLYKRKNVYWLDLRIGGKRVRQSTGTTDRQQASELYAKIVHDSWRHEKLNEPPPRLFEEAGLRWMKDKAHKKSIKDDAQRLRFWLGHFSGRPIHTITADMAYDALQGLKTHRGGIPAPATRNRYLVLLQAILRKAVKWGWIKYAPAFEMEQERNKRVAYFTPEQARLLLRHLPEKHQAPTALAFLTGMRKSNIYGLRWDHVDLTRGVCWVQADEAKGGRNLTVPLNADARAIFEKLLASRPEGEVKVFNHPPIYKDAWDRAVKAAGLPAGLRFHDTRHSFASWHIMAGTDKKTLQELAGWASPAMLERYVHLADSHLAAASERLNGTFWSHGRFSSSSSLPQVVDLFGSPGRTRTSDQRINRGSKE